MNNDTEQFSATVTPGEARVIFQGSMRLRSARDYDAVKALLRGELEKDPPVLVLDFRDLLFLNSSGIGTIGQFIVEARRRATTAIVLHGTAAHPWQTRSLGTLQRIWDRAELRIDT
jgi:hypothetical protein